MTVQVSPAEIDTFCKKLEQFSGGLSDSERTLFQSMLKRDELSDKELGQAAGGATRTAHAVTFKAFAPKLDASFFRVMSW